MLLQAVLGVLKAVPGKGLGLGVGLGVSLGGRLDQCLRFDAEFWRVPQSLGKGEDLGRGMEDFRSRWWLSHGCGEYSWL